MGCDLFFEISVREEVDVAKRVMEDLYFRWKYNQSHHHHHQPSPQPPAHVVTPTQSHHHFGRRCLETFAGRCSANKSNSMDVISEREDGVLPISLSLGKAVQIKQLFYCFDKPLNLQQNHHYRPDQPATKLHRRTSSVPELRRKAA